MKEADAVLKYKELYERALAVGLTLKTKDRFEFNIAEANGLIAMETLSEVELFLRGYELAYKLGL